MQSFVVSAMLLLAQVAAHAAPTPLPRAVPLFSTEDKAPVVLPAAFDGRVLLHVNVDGRMLWFHLDTGSGTLYLGGKDAQTLGLAADSVVGYTQRVNVAIGAVNGSVRFVILPRYGINANGRWISGLIGGPFFHANVVTIDYPHHRVVFYPPGTFIAPAGVKPIPIELRHNTPVIAVSFGEVQGSFYLDTGAAMTELSAPFANRMQLGLSRGSMRLAGGGGLRDDRLYGVTALNLGDVTVKDTVVAVADPPRVDADGILGRDVLSNFAMTLDYANGLVYLDPLR
jgi:predicted aspartyl protease